VAETVSDALRRSTGNFLTQCRRIALLQTDAPRRSRCYSVPEPPLQGLDADRVDASDASGEAYALFHTPDGGLGIASAGMSLALAGMGGATRYR
jgi:hypothetical protein